MVIMGLNNIIILPDHRKSYNGCLLKPGVNLK